MDSHFEANIRSHMVKMALETGREIRQLKEETKHLKEENKQIKEESRQLKDESKQLKEEIDHLKLENLHLKEQLYSVDLFENCQKSISGRLLAENLEMKSGYIQYVWKIDNFISHRDKSKADKRYELYSPEYSTGARGYQFRLLMYPNGRGSHMSLFFQIMKGRWDDELEWPFKLSRKFTLINIDKSKSKSLEDTDWKSDLDGSLGFPKPKTSEGGTLGYAKFADHKMLSEAGFIIGHSLFLKIEVPKYPKEQ